MGMLQEAWEWRRAQEAMQQKLATVNEFPFVFTDDFSEWPPDLKGELPCYAPELEEPLVVEGSQ